MNKSTFIEYLEQIDWKTSGWKHKLYLDGLTPWETQQTLSINANLSSNTFSAYYYNKQKKEGDGVTDVQLEDVATWIWSNMQLLDEVLENNEFDITETNKLIKLRAKDISKKAAITRESRETIETEQICNLLSVVPFDMTDIAIRDHESAAFLKLAHNISPSTISRKCTMITKYQKIDVNTRKDESGYPVKLFPKMLVDAVIAYLTKEAENECV